MEKSKIILELEKLSLLAKDYKEKYDRIEKESLAKDAVSMDFEGFKTAIDTIIENITEKSPDHKL